MKFSLVFVFLSVLFAVSCSLPAINWAARDNDEEIMASNLHALQEKRFVITGAYVARKALTWAINKACQYSNLSDKVKGICSCASLVLGDEETSEAKVETRGWFSVEHARSIAKSACEYSILADPCNCIRLTGFI